MSIENLKEAKKLLDNLVKIYAEKRFGNNISEAVKQIAKYFDVSSKTIDRERSYWDSKRINSSRLPRYAFFLYEYCGEETTRKFLDLVGYLSKEELLNVLKTLNSLGEYDQESKKINSLINFPLGNTADINSTSDNYNNEVKSGLTEIDISKNVDRNTKTKEKITTKHSISELDNLSRIRKRGTAYKTFTARVNTVTLLDDFVPSKIDDIAQRFKPIQQLEEQYVRRATHYAQNFSQYAILKTASTVFTNSAGHMEYVFADFQARIQYFTLVVFGKVSTGKTSFICDITQSSPQKLTELIAQQNGFNRQTDSVTVGTNVETCHLYEFLIEKSCIRLVDVPGIGGVVHDNNTLSPFVDMADCIVFLIDANSDITKDDYDFLYDHVASLGANSSQSGTKTGFTAERGMDKKVLVVINKWKNTYQNSPPQHAEKDWEKKSKWILEGDEKKGFKGISGLFTKAPKVVKANSLMRDDETGEPYEGVKHLLYMEEVVEALREILGDEGAELRLSRPRQVLSRELINVCEQLESIKTAQSLESLTNELEEIGIRVDAKAIDLETDFDTKLNHIQYTFAQILAPQLKLAVRDWEPSVDFMKQAKMLSQGGKEEVEQELKQQWGRELKKLFQEKVNFDSLGKLVEREAKVLPPIVTARFKVEFSNTNHKLREKIIAIAGKPHTALIGVSSPDDLLKTGLILENAVQRVENELLNDLISLVTTDALLTVLFGVILNPIGSALLILGRRLWRGKRKKEEIKGEIDEAINIAVNDAAIVIRGQLTERLRQGIDEISQKFREVLDQEEKELTQHKRLLDEAITEMRELKSRLDVLQIA